MKINLMNHDLRIGFRCKKQSRVALFTAKRLVVLHDTIANQSKSISTNMGMGVGLRNPAVGSPPSVAETSRATQRTVDQHICKCIDPPDGPGSLEFARALNYGDARRIVPSVLETA
jgi:hypothetical protein